MIETILFALLIAKIKGYKLKPLFKSWSVYPTFAFVFLYVLLQAMIFTGNYSFVKYSGIFEVLYHSTFLILIFSYKQYLSAISGSLLMIIGTALNKIAIVSNQGKMPVFPSLSYLTGYVKFDALHVVSSIHVLGNDATRFKILTDYIDLGYSILSIGDVLIRAFTFIMFYQSIKFINRSISE